MKTLKITENFKIITGAITGIIISFLPIIVSYILSI
jgi:hypothetical protein